MNLEFILTSLIVVATPGTGALYTVVTGLSNGRRASLIAAFGCTLGIVPHLAAAMLGLAAILAANETVFRAVRTAGVLYLVYMAIGIWRDQSLLQAKEDRMHRPALEIVRHAVLINLFNPKLSLFFMALLPQFVSPTDPRPIMTIGFEGLAFMAMTLAVFALYGLFAAATRDQVLSRPSMTLWLRRSFAAGFLMLGIRLAFAQR